MDDAVTPDLAGLKALSHPVRMRMLGLLRMDGPATATSLARRLGLNSGATSYHLRQLAQHGFIADDADRGDGRDRWWRAVHRQTYTDPSVVASPEAQDAVDGYLQAVALIHSTNLQLAVEERRLLPTEWAEASAINDWGLRLTPERAAELRDRLVAVVEEFEEDQDAPGAVQFVVNLNAYPYPGALGGDPGGRPR